MVLYGMYDFLEPLFLIPLLSLRPFHARKSNYRVRSGSHDVNPPPRSRSLNILPSDVKYPFAVLLNSWNIHLVKNLAEKGNF